MRIFVLFALSLAGTAILTDDASAIGKRKRGASSSCCGGAAAYGGSGYGGGYSANAMYGSPDGVASSSCCGGAAAYSTGYPGTYMAGGMYSPNMTGQTASGKAMTIQATDGQIYTLGADGSYYAASSIPTMGGFASQPMYSYYGANRGYSSYYPGGVYPAGYNGTYYPSGVYPAGYNSSVYGSPYVYPAGGTSPLVMPGATIPGTNVPLPMPPKK